MDGTNYIKPWTALILIFRVGTGQVPEQAQASKLNGKPLEQYWGHPRYSRCALIASHHSVDIGTKISFIWSIKINHTNSCNSSGLWTQENCNWSKYFIPQSSFSSADRDSKHRSRVTPAASVVSLIEYSEGYEFIYWANSKKFELIKSFCLWERIPPARANEVLKIKTVV